MTSPGSIKKILQPSLLLYGLRLAFACLVALPVFVFLSGIFGGSKLAEGFWPMPHGQALIELLWQSRDLLYIIIPLALLVMAGYFIMLQFIYGGIYHQLWRDDRFLSGGFYKSCGLRFRGFLKIALIGVPLFLIVLLGADLIALLFGKLAGAIGGQTAASVVTYFIVYQAAYMLGGYLIGLRFIQLRDDNSSFRYAYKKLGTLLTFRLKYFVAANLLAGTLTFISLAVALWLVSLPYRLTYGLPAVILVVVIQQAVIFLIGLMEIIQMQINKRVIKEINYGTEMG